MAIPKVFISSTYYDLKQERDNIARFIKDLGYARACRSNLYSKRAVGKRLL